MAAEVNTGQGRNKATGQLAAIGGEENGHDPHPDSRAPGSPAVVTVSLDGIAGLGTAWILDGFEVNVVRSISAASPTRRGRRTHRCRHLRLGCLAIHRRRLLGAIVFGQLTDRFGRKQLFMVTLGIYLLGTVFTACPSPLRGSLHVDLSPEWGSAVSTAQSIRPIDELIPANHRGAWTSDQRQLLAGRHRGSAAGRADARTPAFSRSTSAGVDFVLGAIIGLAVLLVSRDVPESPRWLFIHGREREAEKVVEEIGREVRESTGRQLPEPRGEPLKCTSARPSPSPDHTLGRLTVSPPHDPRTGLVHRAGFLSTRSCSASETYSAFTFILHLVTLRITWQCLL